MPLVEISALLALAAGVLLLRARRVRSRRQKARMLRRALSSADPAVRRAAIQVAGDEGLSRSAEVFLTLVRKEKDASVLLVLAQVVVRNQWEPSTEPSMVRLRLWAHRYLEAMTPAAEIPRRRAARPDDGPSAGEVVNLLLLPARKRRRSWG